MFRYDIHVLRGQPELWNLLEQLRKTLELHGDDNTVRDRVSANAGNFLG